MGTIASQINHQPHDCLLNHLFRHKSKKTSKLRVTGLCAGEFTGDRWIPRTKGQKRGKCFHLMTSSWLSWIKHYRYDNTTKKFILVMINTLRPRQNGRHFADDIFRRISFNENVWILIKVSPKFVPKGPINKIPVLFQIMAWRRSGDKPLFEPMMVSLLTQICVTRPQWVRHIAV